MKLLFTALLCLLLSGCAAPTPQPTEPSQAIVVSRETAEHLAAQYGTAVEAVSLPCAQVQQLWSTEAGLLLQNGQQLLLLDEAFQISAELSLDFVPQTAVSGLAISAFDPQTRQLLLLTPALEELRRVTLPSELSGAPVVSSDGTSLFYCTGQGIYHWDLSSGIRRRMREASCPDLQLVGLHREDTVLQCRLDDRELFLDAQSGQLLQELAAPAQLTTRDGDYYCCFPSGFVLNLVYGTGPEDTMALYPEGAWTQAQFLPESRTAITTAALADGTYRLSCYDLEKGCLRDTLTLHHYPKTILEQSGSIVLLVTEQEQDFLLMWNPAAASSGDQSHAEPYYTADAPDQTGLAACREYARRLSAQYGLEILVGKEAAAAEPWDYTFRPEHRAPVLLEQLQTLEACLSRYPETVLTQTAGHFSSVKLCLVQSITGTAGEGSLSSATGIQFLDGSDAYVVLAAGPYLEQALYHELFHVMEIHILSCSNALDRWNELNPAGFSYDLDHAANARRNSGVYLGGGSRAFVDTYSMSFPKEDRARVFEYAMLEHSGHLFRCDILQQKLAAICKGIRDAYALEKTETDFPWEAHLAPASQ